MPEARWQEEVAELLEQASSAIRARAERRAVSAFGTAIAYLEMASQSGDKLAAQLLSQVASGPHEGPTERFTFQPGELEALTAKDNGGVERTRSGKKKKKK